MQREKLFFVTFPETKQSVLAVCALAAGSAGLTRAGLPERFKPEEPDSLWGLRGHPTDQLHGHVPGSCLQASGQHHPQRGTAVSFCMDGLLFQLQHVSVCKSCLQWYIFRKTHSWNLILTLYMIIFYNHYVGLFAFPLHMAQVSSILHIK